MPDCRSGDRGSIPRGTEIFSPTFFDSSYIISMSKTQTPRVKIQEVVRFVIAPGSCVQEGKYKGHECWVDSETGKLDVSRDAHVSERKAARAYFNGLKKILREANKGTSGVFEEIAEGYLQRKPLTIQQRFNAYLEGCSSEGLVEIGEGAPFNIVSYVDGTYQVEIIKRSE